MSPKTRRTRIEIETHELTRIHSAHGTITTQCQNCGEMVSLSPDVIAYSMDEPRDEEPPQVEEANESVHRRLLRGLLPAKKKERKP